MAHEPTGGVLVARGNPGAAVTWANTGMFSGILQDLTVSDFHPKTPRRQRNFFKTFTDVQPVSPGPALGQTIFVDLIHSADLIGEIELMFSLDVTQTTNLPAVYTSLVGGAAYRAIQEIRVISGHQEFWTIRGEDLMRINAKVYSDEDLALENPLTGIQDGLAGHDDGGVIAYNAQFLGRYPGGVATLPPAVPLPEECLSPPGDAYSWVRGDLRDPGGAAAVRRRNFILSIPFPWTMTTGHYFPLCAMAGELRFEIVMATPAQLLFTNAAATSNVTLQNFKMRAHGIILTEKHKDAVIAMVNARPGGIKYKVWMIEAQRNQVIDTNGAAGRNTFQIQLSNIRGALTQIFTTKQDQLMEAAPFQSVPFKYERIGSYQLESSGKDLWPLTDDFYHSYFLNPRHFANKKPHPIYSILFTMNPMDWYNVTGYLDWQNLQQPTLTLNKPFTVSAIGDGQVWGLNEDPRVSPMWALSYPAAINGVPRAKITTSIAIAHQEFDAVKGRMVKVFH